ncbi:MAG: hypothetical protein ACM3U0_00350 [archaeon]
MNIPLVIVEDSFQIAWKNVVSHLATTKWQYWNIIVQIRQPLNHNVRIHNLVEQFASAKGLLTPKQVAYTIFPFNLRSSYATRAGFYDGYISKLFPRTQKILGHPNWGTYFYRMINYANDGEFVNQLENIIGAINNRIALSHAAFTINITSPGSETIRKMGGPCLNYIAVQIDNNRTINLLAVYRNHDFLKRAYGNYFGLIKLLNFIASETNHAVGRLTCVSSHAYIDNYKRDLINLIQQF